MTTQQRILDELAQRPRTRSELAVLVYRDVRSVQRHLKNLLAASPRRLHITRWERNFPGSPTPVYAQGPGRDAARPTPVSAAKKNSKYRVSADVREAAAKAKKAKRLTPRRDPFLHVMFGTAK